MLGRLQDPSELLGRRGRRRQGQSPLARPRPVLDDLVPGPGRKKMEGQILQVGVDHAGVEQLDRLARLGVERPPLPRQQFRRDSLPGQGVPKGEAVRRDLDDELAGDQLLKLADQFRLRLAGQGLEQGEVEAAAGDCRQGQDAPGARGQVRRALLDRIADAAGNAKLVQRSPFPAAFRPHDVAPLDQGPHDLLDEEGIPLGQGEDGMDEIAPHRAAEPEDRPQHDGDVGFAQRPQQQLGRQPPPIEGGQHVTEVVRDLIAAVRQEEQDRPRRDPAGEAVEEIEAGRVAPVQVLDDHERRPFGGQVVEILEQPMQEAVAIRLPRDLGRRGELRHECRQIGPSRGELSRRILSRETAEVGAEQVGDRGVRERVIGLEALPLEGTETRRLGLSLHGGR